MDINTSQYQQTHTHLDDHTNNNNHHDYYDDYYDDYDMIEIQNLVNYVVDYGLPMQTIYHACQT